MTTNVKKISLLIIAAVLVMALAFAGAASAYKDITNATDFQEELGGSEYASIDGNVVTLKKNVQLDDELVIRNETGLTLDLNGYTVTATKDKRLFTVYCWQDAQDGYHPYVFTLNDTSAAKTGKLIGNGTANGDTPGKEYPNVGGGGVLVFRGKFTMNGGTITGCNNSVKGGGVSVSTDSRVFMNGGTITGCNAPNGGGASVASDTSTFTMNNDASITGCNATSQGGGVYVDSGTFNMNNSAIIKDCNATSQGGGVAGQQGKFNMNNDTSITNCTAQTDGGGIYLTGSVAFTMNDNASITNCTAQNNGGGVLGRITMNGGSITGCKAANGGGVYTHGSGTSIFVNGSATITGNTNSTGAVNNAYLLDNMQLIGDFTGRIGISWVGENHGAAPTLGGKFGTSFGGPHTGAENFFADNNASLVGSIKANNDLVWAKYKPAYVEVNTWDELVENVTEWTDKTKMRTIVVMQDLTNTTGTGNYDGIPVNGKVTIMPKSGAGEIKIDAKQKGRLFDVKTNGNLTLVGNGTATLNLTNGKAPSPTWGSGGAICVDGGNLTLANGAKITNSTTILNGGGVYITNSGTFTMNGGNITGCNAVFSSGGVGVYSGATFTMNGGNITGCYTTDDQSEGCGVYVDLQSTFTMNGGNITGCYTTADQCTGSAVGVHNGTFTMSGKAFIDANNDVHLCDGMYITLGGAFDSNDYGAFNITLANTTIGNVIVNGTTHGKQASTANFKLSSALSDYQLKANGNDLVLGEKPTYVEVSSWDQLVANVTDWTNTTKMRTIAVTGDVKNTQGSNYKGIPVVGNITVTTLKDSNAAIDANKMGRLFNVTGGNLRLIGNGTSTLKLVNGLMNNAGAVMVDTGNLTISSGANITDCTATNCGGAVFVDTGSLTMDGGNITGCSATAGGAVFVNFNGKSFDMTGGSITDCTVSNNGGGVLIWTSGDKFAKFNVSGSATITGNTKNDASTDVISDNNVCLKSAGSLNLTGPFTGTISIVEPAGAAGTTFGTYVSGYEAYAKNFLSDTPGFRGNATGIGLVWEYINTTVTPKNNIAEFHNTNSTTLKTTDVVSMIVLENVSNVNDNTPVVFNASSAITKSLPVSSGYKKIEDVAIFDIEAEPSTGSSSYINVTLTFADADTVDEYKEKASFWHSADGDWETPKLDSEIIATNEAKVTYKVVTDEFSPFGVTIETKESTPYVPSSHSKQTGSTVILKDGEVVPTVTPTATPGVPTVAPSTKPTTNPTQKSPAPFVGLIAGLGIAGLVLARLRK